MWKVNRCPKSLQSTGWNERTWTSVILENIECGNLQHALRLYEEMRGNCIDPSSFTLVGVLKACGSLGNPERGREIYEEVVDKGLIKVDDESGGAVVVVNTLISMYTKCGELAKAEQVLEELPVRDVVSWTTLLKGYAQNGQNHEALKCFESMRSEGLSPDSIAFISLLKACENEDKDKLIHDSSVGRSFLEKNIDRSSALVDKYAKCDIIGKLQVVEKLPVQHVSFWNALGSGYSQQQGKCSETWNCGKRTNEYGRNSSGLNHCGMPILTW